MRRRIFFISGKGGSGKDTVAKCVSERLSIPIVPIHTTREPRPDDKNTYYCTDEEIQKLPNKEMRGYQHVDRYVYYATSKCDVSDDFDYIAVGPSEMYQNFVTLFSDRDVVPIVLDVSRGTRYKRTQYRGDRGETERRLRADDAEWLDIFDSGDYVDGNGHLHSVVDNVVKRILCVLNDV